MQIYSFFHFSSLSTFPVLYLFWRIFGILIINILYLYIYLALILLTNFFCCRLHNAFYNTTAEYNSIDLIPAGAVAVSDTDVTRKETNLSFLFIELVRIKDGIFLDTRATLVVSHVQFVFLHLHMTVDRVYELVCQGGCLGLWLGVGVAQMFLSSHQLLNHFLCRAASK